MGNKAANGQRESDRAEGSRASRRAAPRTAAILKAVGSRAALALLCALWLVCAPSLAHAAPLTSGFLTNAAGAIFPSASALSSQTITFAAIGNKTYGVAPFTVTATASSSLPVSLASLTVPVCTVSGNAVTVVAAGTCTIQATQPGDTTYAAAPSVSRSFAVAKASQTITFPAISGKTFGAASFRLVATASSGLGVSLASTTPSVCTLAGPMLNIIAAGTCSIQASQAGDGNYNAAATITRTFTVAQASQTIAFAAPGAKTFGDPPFAVSATATSGLPVGFTSTTTVVCKLTGATITIVGAGTCTIQASQAGNANYKPASSVSRSFSVAKAAQTITFGGLSAVTFGAPPFNVSASASSGLPVSFASTTSAVCTLNGTTVTIIAGGTCTIRASQAGNGNYAAAANVNQSFTVAKASQAISFAPLSPAIIGAPPFVISATASSGLPVSFVSTTTSVCTVSGATVTIIAAGTCTIRASQAGNSGYAAAANVSQSFTVAKAAQSITFAPLIDRLLGGAPFTVSATASSGLAVTFASTTTTVCTVSGTTVTIVALGTCTISASQAGNSSYSAAPNVSQSFAVTSPLQSQTISFGALSNQTFGGAPFTVSATASSALPVSFASLTAPVCAVSGSTVTLLGAGTCTIQASQAGNASYLPAPNVNQSFTVAKGAQTISFGALGSQVLGAAPFNVAATASSGLPVTFGSLTAAVCTVSAATVTLLSAGTCTIQASQPGNANYSAAPNVAQSFAVTVVLQSQTISFGALGNRTFGAAPFTVSATASSGLTVSFASLTNPVCTMSGTTVTLVSAGTCTIQASQAGNATYAAAPNVSQSLTVAQAAQTISFGPLGSQLLGAAPFTVNATASSGLPVGFASLTLTVCTVSTATVTLLSAGTCTIQASQAGNANYTAALNVSQSFAVTSVLQSQTITFGALTNQILGAAPFTLSATASSGLPVSFASLTTPVCTVTGSTVTLVGAGTCTLQASQAGNSTYAAAPNVSQSFTVAKASQTIVFGALASRSLGAAPFTVSATASSGLAVSFVSLTTTICTISSSTVTLIATGACTIEASQAGNANYAAAANIDQTFTVTGASQTISFAVAVNYTTGSNPSGVVIADFNRDGKADLAVVNQISSSVLLFIGNGNGTFVPGVTLATGSAPTQIVAADFNGDGNIDLAITNVLGDSVTVYLGNGNGTFGAPRTVAAGSAPFGIKAADLNGDGKIDLVVANGSSGSIVGQTVTVLLGNGDGTFQPARATLTGTNPLAVAIADFNGDGKLDLAVTSAANNYVSILLGNGDGTFRPQVTYGAGLYPRALSVGDFNGDGKPDLAVINGNGGSASILIGNGDGTFGAATNYTVGFAPATIATGDFNGDGIVDIVSTNTLDNIIVVLQGNGNGTFKPPISFPVGTNPGDMAAGDLNGDGKLDLVVSNYVSNTISVLLNAPSGITVSALTGTPQSALINTPYATALSAIARDASNAAIVGATVTFTAPPGSSASGTFQGTTNIIAVTTNASGVATAPAFTANSIAGAFTVTAGYSGSSANFALTNTTPAPINQTITFGALSNKTLGAPPFALTASASSGLPVTFSSLTVPVCVVSGNTATLVALGTCTIRAAQAGNGIYAAAPNVDQSFSVTAVPTIQYTYDAAGNLIGIQRNGSP